MHGLFSESGDYDTIQHLVDKNFRVLAFDLYGMGWSSAPSNIRYDEKLYLGQLTELLFVLKVNEPFILMGHSMGGGMFISS